MKKSHAMNVSSPRAKHFKTALIVDDHPLFCDALSMTLKMISQIEDLFTAANLSEALESLRTINKVDLVVLDLNLPDVDGLEGLIRIRKKSRVPVMVVSSMADNRMVSSAIQAGAMGFVPKHSPREVFATAIETLRNGEIYLPEGCVLLQDDPSLGPSPNDILVRLETLTNQQARILHLICEGKLNKQIAHDLSIAETTVKAHVTAIMRKLGVQSRTQAVVMANEASFSSVMQDHP